MSGRRARRPEAGHGHGHGHGGSDVGLRGRAAAALWGSMVAFAALTIVAMALLWPRHATPSLPDLPGDQPANLVHARVLSTNPYQCEGTGSSIGPNGQPTKVLCGQANVRITSGPTKGDAATVLLQPEVYRTGISHGEDLLVSRFPPQPGETTKADYAFADFARGSPMVWLGVLFALVVVVVARLRGLAALVGLGVSALVITKFVLPALLDGRPALLVGVVGGAAIMFTVVYAAHGISVRTSTALLGTLLGLTVTAGLGTWAVNGFHLTGVSGEDDQYLTAVAGQISLPAVLLCGIVIASLGVLNDITVTQAAAVWELHATDPAQSTARLFRSAMRIGRDHIASTVYTLVFAYAGAALPILLLIDISHQPTSSVLTSEPLAEEIARTLAGSIGLVLAVPLTTAIAVALARRSTPGRLG
ncbi:MAG TPA: YibE/F family protein [Sporichthyaceae bacterium]|nr:YibE/F family protein [Sporichthyaceae bacterium]